MRQFRYVMELYLPDGEEPLGAGVVEVAMAELAEGRGLSPLRYDGTRKPGGGVCVGYQEILPGDAS